MEEKSTGPSEALSPSKKSGPANKPVQQDKAYHKHADRGNVGHKANMGDDEDPPQLHPWT